MTVQNQARLADAVIGEAIRTRRLALGMSSDAIASRWEKPGSYVTLVEAGVLRPEPGELTDMATLFKCQLSDLFDEAIKNSPA